jgi:hypothetical protein
MFLQNSRYRQVPDEVTVDVKGRRLVSKSIRQPPPGTGTFQHTIEDGDRLDHLAYKYYKQPRKWWHICDANLEFMSPQALLGKTPIITQHFPLSFTDPENKPRWAELLRDIAALVGVETVLLADDDKSVIVTFNKMNIQSGDIADTIKEQGLVVESPQTIGRTGKGIVIPPNILG